MIVDELKKVRRAVVLGMAEDTRTLVPWDELEDAPDTLVFVLNEMLHTEHKNYGFVRRWDVNFQLHPEWDFTREANYNDEDHYVILQKEHGKPIYMQKQYPEIPDAVEFPLDDILANHSEYAKRFTATLPYVLAILAHVYAEYRNLEKIDLYGFSMGSETEYMYQRDTSLFWLGVLEGFYRVTGGPELYIPERSKLHPQWFKLYGYEGTQLVAPEDLKARAERWRNVEAEWQGKFEESLQAVAQGMDIGRTPEDMQVEIQRRSENFQRFWGARAKRLENEYWLQTGVPVPRMHFELRNNAWKKDHEKAKVLLNSYAGNAQRLQNEIGEIASRKRGLRESKNRELRELIAKQERYAQALIFSGAAMEENQRWIRQCDMVHHGFEPEEDTDIIPGLMLQFVEE